MKKTDKDTNDTPELLFAETCEQQPEGEEFYIDWTKSVAEIDQQLYKKYGLTEKEIEFIETHVEPME